MRRFYRTRIYKEFIEQSYIISREGYILHFRYTLNYTTLSIFCIRSTMLRVLRVISKNIRNPVFLAHRLIQGRTSANKRRGQVQVPPSRSGWTTRWYRNRENRPWHLSCSTWLRLASWQRHFRGCVHLSSVFHRARSLNSLFNYTICRNGVPFNAILSLPSLVASRKLRSLGFPRILPSPTFLDTLALISCHNPDPEGRKTPS